MTGWFRWTVALVLCTLGAALGLVPSATAAPVADAGFGTVLADLGTAQVYFTQPGFSFDGRYYAYLAPAGDRCDLHLYDVPARRPVTLTHAHVLRDYYPHWAVQADTLIWQVNAAAGDVTAYVWDADPGRVAVLAPDAHVFDTLGVSADGRYLAFRGRSDTRPAPAVDLPRYAGYIYDRGAGVSLPLSKPGLHVEFGEWGPTGHRFVARSGGGTTPAPTGACLGSGTSCGVVSTDYLYFGGRWSHDGAAVLGGPGNAVYDFTDGSLTPFPDSKGFVDHTSFLGADADRVLGYRNPGLGAVLWDRRTGAVSTVASPGAPDASPTGRYLLFHDTQPDAYRYLDVSTGMAAPATYRGTSNYFVGDGFWTKDGSTYLGVGPGGCSSLRQWTVPTNTVSLFGPPKARSCYYAPDAPAGGSSASSRFASVYERDPTGSSLGDAYLVDLRRHVLVGPLDGYLKSFAPAGPDLAVFAQSAPDRTERLLLVDLAPSPDVDDKPRWSAATPATSAQVEAAVGEQAHVQLGASDLQGTPVNLYFRWRDTAGTPIRSAPKGWSCERRRLAAGATVADCTFAPPKDFTATRFLDVSATNSATGAQSDTRSYRVAVG